MEFIQSRFQDIFSRCYETACELFWYAVGFIALSVVLSEKISFLGITWTYLLMALCPILYILLIHKKASKRIVIDEEKFIFVDGDTEATIAWSDFQGYKVSRAIPHKITIKNPIYANISFSYYAFSAAQRRRLFDIFDKKCDEQER